MKILFQPIYLESPHFETELELMANHLEAGDEVLVLGCRGELATCFANYDHEQHLCDLCTARFSMGLGVLPGNVRVLDYPLPPRSSYPELPDVLPDFDALKAFRIGAARIGLAAASSLCMRMGTHRFDPVQHQRAVAVELSTAWYVFQSFREILSREKPDRVYLFNGRFSAVLPALNACELLGVPYSTHERAGRLDRYWVVADGVPHDIEGAHRELLALWSSMPEEEAVRIGSSFFADRRNGESHGWHAFTEDQSAGALPEGWDASKTNVVVFDSDLEEFAAVTTSPSSFRVYAGEADAISSICEAFAGRPGHHFYLRVHPGLRGRDNAQTRELRALEDLPNLTIIPPGSSVDSYALMDAGAAVVTFGSTMGAEACFWGRPSILLGPAYYEHLDCAYRPATHDDVVALLERPPVPRPAIEAVKYGLWALEMGTRFRRYRPEGLSRGVFQGVRLAMLEVVPGQEGASPAKRDEMRTSRTTPTVSVVIPTWNRAGHLRACLQSLVGQTYRDFEVLVCDDGSTDETPDVVRQFESVLDLRFLQAEHWGGPARPRNAGIAAARGEWIAFLDSDDTWHPEKLATCLPLLPDNDVVWHAVEVCSSAGRTGEVVGRSLRWPAAIDLLTNLNALPNSGTMVRASVVREAGGLSEDRGLIGVEDYDLWIRVALLTERFCYVETVLGAYTALGATHNISASLRQIDAEKHVFALHAHRLSEQERRIAERHWHERHAAMSGASTVC
jgi:GT2 family glycosyltransferase